MSSVNALSGSRTRSMSVTNPASNLISKPFLRLVLDLNLAAEAIGQTVEEIRAIVAAFRPFFSAACTY
jgi:hypothetical protein